MSSSPPRRRGRHFQRIVGIFTILSVFLYFVPPSRIGSFIYSLRWDTSIEHSNWGPDRTVYEEDQREEIPGPEINSVTNSPNYGDERDFLLARRDGESGREWKNSLSIEKGQRYEVRMFVRNNSTTDPIQSIFVDIEPPKWINAGETKPIKAKIRNDATPHAELFDDIKLTNHSDTPRYVDPLEETVKLIRNNDAEEDIAGRWIESETSAFILAGRRQPELGPGETAEIMFDFTVEERFLGVEYFVRESGQSAWGKSASSRTDIGFEHRVRYTNLGTLYGEDVVLNLYAAPVASGVPTVIDFIRMGTTESAAIDIAPLINDGLNMGSYEPGEGFELHFTSKFKPNICGKQTWTLIAISGGQEERRTLITERPCE